MMNLHIVSRGQCRQQPDGTRASHWSESFFKVDSGGRLPEFPPRTVLAFLPTCVTYVFKDDFTVDGFLSFCPADWLPALFVWKGGRLALLQHALLLRPDGLSVFEKFRIIQRHRLLPYLLRARYAFIHLICFSVFRFRSLFTVPIFFGRLSCLFYIPFTLYLVEGFFSLAWLLQGLFSSGSPLLRIMCDIDARWLPEQTAKDVLSSRILVCHLFVM